MDFSKLTSSKRPTKLSEKAQASVDHGANSQLKSKRKHINGDDSPAPPKKGRLTRPDGTLNNKHRPTATGSARSAVSLASSLGPLGDATITTSPTDPSDHELLTGELTRGVDGSSVEGNVIDLDDSEDNEDKNENDQWVDEHESPEDELSMY